MKKVLAIVAALMLIPFAAYGMQSISEKEMSEVSGQSGVAITIDDVVIHNSGDGEVWYQNEYTETDGNDTSTSQAAVGLRDEEEKVESMMYVNAITGVDGSNSDAEFESPGDGLKGTYTDLADGDFEYDMDGDFKPSPLTVRVRNIQADDVEGSAFAAAMEYGEKEGDMDAVIIGLPTVEIMEEGTTTAKEILMTDEENPVADAGDAESVGGSGQGTHSFGTLYSGGDSSMAILDGQIEIAPYSAYANQEDN